MNDQAVTTTTTYYTKWTTSHLVSVSNRDATNGLQYGHIWKGKKRHRVKVEKLKYERTLESNW